MPKRIGTLRLANARPLGPRCGRHEAELTTMARVFADVKTTDEVVAMLAGVTPRSVSVDLSVGF
jgi:hypothetical protein